MGAAPGPCSRTVLAPEGVRYGPTLFFHPGPLLKLAVAGVRVTCRSFQFQQLLWGLRHLRAFPPSGDPAFPQYPLFSPDPRDCVFRLLPILGSLT
jgi:hypothetical protein